MTEPPIRVLLVDDHQVVRIGLATLLAAVPRFEVAGEAGDLAGAVAEARRCRPDVVLMDVRLPDGSGIEACREIRSDRPDTRVIMLTAYPDEDAVVQAILAGAAGYFLKQGDTARLVEGIEIVARGGSLLDPATTEAVLQWMRRAVAEQGSDPLAALNEHERNILPLIAEGKTNREIAGALYLSEHTVKGYVSSILRKLHLNRRAQAAALSAQRPAT